jgi:hypothetical protein
MAPKIGAFGAAVVGATGYLVTMAVVVAMLPSFDEAPGALTDASGMLVFPGFPAQVLADFRMYSVLSQTAMWLVIGVAFAALVGRSARQGVTAPALVTAAAV